MASLARRLLRDLRWSMAAQIAASIAVISIVLIAAGGFAIERIFVKQLQRDNELMLIARLAFLRDDMAAPTFDPGRDGPALAELNERRINRLRVALFDDQRRLIARSPNFPTPGDQLPDVIVSADDLARDMTSQHIEAVRERYGRFTRIWYAPDGQRYRMLVGRLDVPAAGTRAARPILVALAIQTTSMVLRHEDQRNLLVALAIALVVSLLLGLWIARRIVTGVKRMGVAASGIGAKALDARLPLAGTPTELVASTVAFNRMLDRLQLSFERLSTFSSDLAHDLRTPIGNLLGEAQVTLSRPRSAEEYRAVLESAVEEYERLSRMIANMLFLARADNAQAVVAIEPLEVREALDRVLSYFEQVAEDRGITLVAAVDRSIDAATEPASGPAGASSGTSPMDSAPSVSSDSLAESSARSPDRSSTGSTRPSHESSGAAPTAPSTGSPDDAAVVHADETMLVRAVSNLVSNAVRHATAGTRVDLRAQVAIDGTCTISVSNEGPAIASDVQARIFERFFRADRSRANSTTGSGLGLAIVKSIMDLHRGRVSVTSAPGERTVFALSFPAGPGPARKH